MSSFFQTDTTSLKICGVTLEKEAQQLVELGVEAIGINFWEKSKRYLEPNKARAFLPQLTGKIVRVGVFVNAPEEVPSQLIEDNIIDYAQFHGDEPAEYCAAFAEANLPFIKAIGVKNAASLKNIQDYRASAILLDTPAPGVYGGTGEKFDWTHAKKFILNNPDIPVILAGGITPENAAEAIDAVHPAALDVASGAELSPGLKDFKKIIALKNITS